MTSWMFSFTPLFDWPVLVGLGLLAALTLGLSFYARRRGTILRALGFALLLLALTGPALVREDRESLKEVVAIVVDKSGSQTIGERPQQTDAALAGLQKSLNALGNIDTRVINASSNQDGTELFSALSNGLADVPAERIGGVFMITDGVVHDIPRESAALGFKAPLHALITGHEGEHDRRIELLESPRFGIVGKDQTIELRVLDSANRPDAVLLRVRRDGIPITTLLAKPGERMKIPVRIEHGGQNVVEIDFAAQPDELTAINNKAVLTIDGVRDKLKVLLVSGEPHNGERMWRNLLKSDANVDLVHFTILRPPEKQDGTPINELSLIAFPTADLFGRKISDFDLIVFDRYSNQSILPQVYFDNIVRYVRDGGALMLAAGLDFSQPEGLYYSPLGRISPARPDGSVTEKPFFAAISEDGAKHPVTRGLDKINPKSGSNAPWSPWFAQVNTEVARGTNVLSGADQKPLLVLSREGKGRVALLLSDQMWLWARGFQGGGPYQDLLRRLAHWLMKEPELEEEALRAQVRGNKLEIERQTLKSSASPVTVTSPSGEKETVTLAQAEPGLWRGEISASELGLYRLTDGSLTYLANAGPDNPREFQEVVSTPEKLRPLAEATGGTVRRISSGQDGAVAMPRLVAMHDSPVYGGEDYAAIKRTGASEVKGLGVAPLAIGFLGLLFVLGGVLAGWVYEARAGRKTL